MKTIDKMTWRPVIGALLLTTALAANSFAANPLKIGIFDVKQVMGESKKAGVYRSKVMSELDAKRKVFLARESAVAQTQEKLAKEGQTLSVGDRKALEWKFASESRDLKRLREDLDREIQGMDQELTAQVLQEIQAVVVAVAKAGHYSAMFERGSSGIAFVDESLDVTKKIISEYDGK